ncbi:unnamed protein product, partial [Staurois parvus]
MNSAQLLVSVEGSVPHCLCFWKEMCPSETNTATSLILLGGIVLHCIDIVYYRSCKWQDLCTIVGVSGRNDVPLLESVDGIVPQGLNKSKQRAT